MRAVVIERSSSGEHRVSLTNFAERDLMPGNVTVRVQYSTINYKDALALRAGAPIVRRFPMIPGIDFAGVVESSEHAEFKAGDAVLLNGWGTAETHLGAYAERTRVNGDWLIPLPAGLTAREAMSIGTAGYTAMLSVMALERYGLTPEAGPVLVTGATGGVGSVAVSLLAQTGWHVIASTGRAAEQTAYLRDLGAQEVIDRAELNGVAKSLGKERWAAGVDSVGSSTLANVLAATKRAGAIAACGLAQGMDLPGSVAPFILRGVALLGIDSVFAPKALRLQAWDRLSRELDRDRLAMMTTEFGMEEILGAGRDLLDGKLRGRSLVRIEGSQPVSA